MKHVSIESVVSDPIPDAVLSPAARHLVESQSLSLKGVKASAKNGRVITKADVLAVIAYNSVNASNTVAVSSSAVSPVFVPPVAESIAYPAKAAVPFVASADDAVNDRYQDISNSNMRKVIAKRLTESKATVPHFYTTIECNLDNVLALRQKLKKQLDLNVSVNDLVIKCAAMALRDVPETHAKWNAATSSPVLSSSVDISVAVATPNGLITPIVFGADQRSIVNINATVKALAGKAREGKLKPEEYQGGSFSISNLGT